MTRLTSIFFALALAASALFGQVSGSSTTRTRRFQPETKAERVARLAAHERQEIALRDMMRKARAAALSSPVPQGVNILCKANILVSNPAYGQLQTLCDEDGDGVADFVGTFRQFSDDYPAAMAPLNGYLFVLTGDGTVNTFTDISSRGIADSAYGQPAVGLASSSRIMPVSGYEINCFIDL